MTTAWLIDATALARLGRDPDDSLWFERISRRLVRISTITLLEVGFSARTGEDWQGLIERPPVKAMPVELMTPVVEHRAVDVQGMLARRGHHRAPSIPDLLVAATGEAAGLTILHCDKGFELIAGLTGQAHHHVPG